MLMCLMLAIGDTYFVIDTEFTTVIQPVKKVVNSSKFTTIIFYFFEMG